MKTTTTGGGVIRLGQRLMVVVLNKNRGSNFIFDDHIELNTQLDEELMRPSRAAKELRKIGHFWAFIFRQSHLIRNVAPGDDLTIFANHHVNQSFVLLIIDKIFGFRWIGRQFVKFPRSNVFQLVTARCGK